MDRDRFVNLLTAFADQPASVDIHKGDLLVSIHDTVIAATISTQQGAVFVNEDGPPMRAEEWLIKRIARIPLLAERLLTHLPHEQHFVTPRGELVDDFSSDASAARHTVEDATRSVVEWISRRPAFLSRVLYLTSDAGEGKTTLIEHIARHQAAEYKAKRTDWLLVPVSLGGRPFLRLDEAILGALGNRLRFQLLYYDAFIELVRLGVLVLALDGFEEMFVESPSGDAVSALGNLIDTLKSEGTVVVAARKAFFEYKSLETTARLIDTMRSQYVTFAQMDLQRWSKEQFVAYAGNRRVRNPEAVYEKLSSRLGRADHPIMTRPVLVKHLCEPLEDADDPLHVIDALSIDKEDYYCSFVGNILLREANKWVDRSGEPFGPLISFEEHFALLSDVATEMWDSEAEELPGDIMDLVAEGYCQANRKPAAVSAQVLNRIKQHALIVSTGNGRPKFRFDHPEFYQFFLGEGVARALLSGDSAQTRRILRRGLLPTFAVRSAFNYLLRQQEVLAGVLRDLNVLSANESGFTFIRENCGALAMWIAEKLSSQGHEVTLTKMVFGSDSLSSRRLYGVQCAECYFQPTTLFETTLQRCRFDRCEFEQLEVTSSAVIESTTLEQCSITSVLLNEEDGLGVGHAVYDPGSIDAYLRTRGFEIDVEVEDRQEARPIREADEELVVAERFVRVFQRATGVSESVVRQRLGRLATKFFDDVLPALKHHGIVVSVPYRGSGTQARYGLGVGMQRVSQALEECGGSFEVFCARCGESGE